MQQVHCLHLWTQHFVSCGVVVQQCPACVHKAVEYLPPATNSSALRPHVPYDAKYAGTTIHFWMYLPGCREEDILCTWRKGCTCIMSLHCLQVAVEPSSPLPSMPWRLFFIPCYWLTWPSHHLCTTWTTTLSKSRRNDYELKHHPPIADTTTMSDAPLSLLLRSRFASSVHVCSSRACMVFCLYSAETAWSYRRSCKLVRVHCTG